MDKQDKRHQIVDAALRVMSEKGYDKASIKDIATEAGITPGLVHYYFSNKQEILISVLMETSKQYTQEMSYLRANVTSEHLAGAALNEPKKRVYEQPEWYRLRYELFALGLRTPDIAPGVETLLSNARQGIVAILHSVFQDVREDNEFIAAILVACFDGLALQKLVNSDFDLDGAYAVLTKMAMSLQRAD